MYIWFYVIVASLFLATYLHFKSVEHTKLKEEYGERRGVRIGRIYGTISGGMESVLLVGLWVSPQPRFILPICQGLAVSIVNVSIPILSLIISLPLIAAGAWLGIGGVRAIGIEVADTHGTPERIATTGVYSIVRHPQYLGWLLAHVGFSFLLSAYYSILFTPVLASIVYMISKKEEEELIKEFGDEYRDYRERVPMLIPRLR